MKPDCPRCGLSEGWDGVECSICNYKPRTPSIYESSPSSSPEETRRIILSPSCLVLAGVLFLLPWVEIRCDLGVGSQTLMSQSGYQAMTGDVSLLPLFEKMVKESPADTSLAALKADKAPLVLPYLICVVIGAIAGFTVTHASLRSSVVAVCCAGAIGLLIVQTWVMEFPLVKEVETQKKQAMNERRERRNQVRGNDPVGRDAEAFADAAIGPRYSIWYWLSYGACAVALLGITPAFRRSGSMRR